MNNYIYISKCTNNWIIVGCVMNLAEHEINLSFIETESLSGCHIWCAMLEQFRAERNRRLALVAGWKSRYNIII